MQFISLLFLYVAQPEDEEVIDSLCVIVFLVGVQLPAIAFAGYQLNDKIKARKEYKRQQYNISISNEVARYENDIISLEIEVKDVQSINHLAMLLIACDKEACELIKQPEMSGILAINDEIAIKRKKIEDLKKKYHS